MSRIIALHAREILDSRAQPTLEVEVVLADGIIARAQVPSGASIGSHEAIEMRDHDATRYLGKGVLTAKNIVEEKLIHVVTDFDVTEQRAIDYAMISADGSDNKRNFGANSILAVSLAVAKAAAVSLNISLFRYLGGVDAHILPVPLMNIINGGAHANNSIDFQEFMIMPLGAANFQEAIAWGAEVYKALLAQLTKRNLSTALGDEGGFAPDIENNRAALDYILKAIDDTGLKPGSQIALALDVAATEFYSKKIYSFENKRFNVGEMITYYRSLINDYPIVSIEDPLAEDDWEGWAQLTKSLKAKVQIVGDDLFVTNYKRIELGIANGSATGLLVKLNQIGTLTETIQAMRIADRAGYGLIVSHRSGETEDTTIADLSVATNCGQIKTGAPARGERIAKYNQLLRIEDELGEMAKYAGSAAIKKF